MMAQGPPTETERHDIDAIARYQFDLRGSTAFCPPTAVEVTHSSSGRIEQVYHDGVRLCTLTTHGRLTLGVAGGRRLAAICEAPANRVAVDDEARPFVGAGRNAFAKFVTAVDSQVRPRDEVVVVDGADRPIAVGRAELAAEGMVAFDRGMAVSVRHGLLDDTV